jgi:hypothetical protein
MSRAAAAASGLQVQQVMAGTKIVDVTTALEQTLQVWNIQDASHEHHGMQAMSRHPHRPLLAVVDRQVHKTMLYSATDAAVSQGLAQGHCNPHLCTSMQCCFQLVEGCARGALTCPTLALPSSRSPCRAAAQLLPWQTLAC